MYERLPTPWGLVRLGVAPDHPNIKAVSRVFEKVAQQPGFRFFGNVEIGRDLSRDDLREHYHAVIWSVGAQPDRRMGIPGEDLPGSLSATAFVAWYNGHPDFRRLDIDLDIERIVVVGNGNVAVDCARMLGADPRGAEPDRHRRPRDQGDRRVAGQGDRRCSAAAGPLEAAFTTPELMELGELEGADVVVDPAEVDARDPASDASWPATTPRSPTATSR